MLGMMNSDLYDLLEIKSDATAEQVASAYRKMAKLTHPDVAGPSAGFEKIAEAAKILMNPDLRAHYDSTGTWEDYRFDDRPLSILSKCIEACITQSDDPTTINLPTLMAKAIESNIQNIKEASADARHAAERAKRVSYRFSTRKESQTNHMASLAEAHYRDMKSAQDDAKINIADHRRALEILNQHRYNWDKPHDVLSGRFLRKR